MARASVKILVIDVGGTNIKVLASGRRTPIKIPSGPRMTPRVMVDRGPGGDVWIGSTTWCRSDIRAGVDAGVRCANPGTSVGAGSGSTTRRRCDRPVRIINDAAMQALGSYAGGSMLFLGLGTGLGSTMIVDKTLIPLELAHLPYVHGKTYEEYLGEAGFRELGKRAWRRHVAAWSRCSSTPFASTTSCLGEGTPSASTIFRRIRGSEQTRTRSRADSVSGGKGVACHPDGRAAAGGPASRALTEHDPTVSSARHHSGEWAELSASPPRAGRALGRAVGEPVLPQHAFARASGARRQTDPFERARARSGSAPAVVLARTRPTSTRATARATRTTSSTRSAADTARKCRGAR